MEQQHYIHDGKLVKLSRAQLKRGMYEIPIELNILNGDYEYKIPDSLYSVVRSGTLSPLTPCQKILGFCAFCNETILDNHKYIIRGKGSSIKLVEGDTLVCSKCINTLFNCENCSRFFVESELDKETKLCLNCHISVPKKYINSYQYKIADDVPPIGESKDGILYGIELEYETPNLSTDLFNLFELISKWGVFKRDSSLESGFEIVTTPCSLEFHYEIWEKFFTKLPRTVKVYRNCGMHVHATRNRLTNLQIGKMLVFLHSPFNRKFVEIIAERKSNVQNNYESLKTYKDGKHGGIQQNSDRHTALNLNNYNTIEFRIFTSPKNHLTLLKNVEFCKALIKFTGMAEHSITDAKNYQVFCNYVKMYRKEYSFLAKFLKDKNLI